MRLTERIFFALRKQQKTLGFGLLMLLATGGIGTEITGYQAKSLSSKCSRIEADFDQRMLSSQLASLKIDSMIIRLNLLSERERDNIANQNDIVQSDLNDLKDENRNFLNSEIPAMEREIQITCQKARNLEAASAFMGGIFNLVLTFALFYLGFLFAAPKDA